MSEQEITRLNVNLTAKGTSKIEAQVSEDLKRIDPDPVVGKDIVEQALGETRGKNNGDSNPVG